MRYYRPLGDATDATDATTTKPAPIRPDLPKDKVAFFENPNCGGKRFYAAVQDPPARVDLGGWWNDQISSIHVPAGMMVGVWEHQAGGGHYGEILGGERGAIREAGRDLSLDNKISGFIVRDIAKETLDAEKAALEAEISEIEQIRELAESKVAAAEELLRTMQQSGTTIEEYDDLVSEMERNAEIADAEKAVAVELATAQALKRAEYELTRGTGTPWLLWAGLGIAAIGGGYLVLRRRK